MIGWHPACSFGHGSVHSSLLRPLLRSLWHKPRAKRVMEAVEKCIKQIREKGLQNPTNFPSALLFSNLAFKLNSLRWSIYVFMTKLPIWQLSWEALNHWRFIKSSNSHHNNLSSFSNSTFEVWIQEEVFLSSVRKKLITWHRADLHVTWTPFQWLLLISDIWPLIQNFTLKQLNSLRFLFSFIEKLRTPEKNWPQMSVMNLVVSNA